METSAASHITVHALPSEPGPRRCRDHELLLYIACQGVVAIDHVMSWLVVGRTAAYRRVAHCVDAGLIERLELLRTEPSLLRVTRKGLRYLGLDALPVAEVTAATAPHWLRCASVNRHLYENEFESHEIWSERDIRFAESRAGESIASAKVGELPTGGPRLHRPDLAVVTYDDIPNSTPWDPSAPDGPKAQDFEIPRPDDPTVSGRQGPSSPRTQGGMRGERTSECVTRSGPTDDTGMRSVPGVQNVIAIEVELSLKTPRRLEAILRGWRRAREVIEVRYYCAPGPVTRGLERAVAKTHTAEKVRILEVPPR